MDSEEKKVLNNVHHSWIILCRCCGNYPCVCKDEHKIECSLSTFQLRKRKKFRTKEEKLRWERLLEKELQDRPG